MGSKKKHRKRSVVPTVPLADWLPPESSPSHYYSQLMFTDVEAGTGPLCIVGRELQLVWYDTKKDRDRERHGKLVAVLEFHGCQRCPGCHGERFRFTALLMEDISDEYRKWVGNQEHQGRSFTDSTDVLETTVRFSVVDRDAIERQGLPSTTAAQPFFLEQPEVDELSSPQLDILFDVMSFLYQSIPAMKLMEDFRTQHDAELAK